MVQYNQVKGELNREKEINTMMITRTEARANVERVREEEKKALRNEALKEVEKVCELINKASNKGLTSIDVKELDTERLNKEMIRILVEELKFTVVNYVAVDEFRVQW